MPAYRHCKHCWGDCDGCVLPGDTGACIHKSGAAMLPIQRRARLWLRRLRRR